MSSRRPKAVVAAGPGGAGALERRSSRRPKAVVAMSGGVDSSVAAALLVQRGYDVTGIMLKLWRGEAANSDSGCCNVGAADDARRVADILDIPFYVLNFAQRFEESVIRDFRATYAGGATPNPCVRCNQWIKFDSLLERARTLGAEVLATGHYARVAGSGGRLRLLRGVDSDKDQSYVLWMLSQSQLAHCCFPVGDMSKTETRALAGQLGLRNATKPDSQEICFVRGGDLPAYISEHIPAASKPGPVIDGSGVVVGEHGGVGRYTIGQRKGLGLSLGKPVYVTAIDASSNTLRVGPRAQLSVGEVSLQEVSFVDSAPPPGARLLSQHRAHGETAPCRIVSVSAGGARLIYDRPVDAVAPGQSAAFYSWDDPDQLLGGGIVAATVPAAVAQTG
jgi:tRNA-specific 2-thiouridylase